MRFIFFLLVIILVSCKNQEETQSEYAAFEAFYERFHQDSIYQIEHIVFPLEGLPREADSLTIAEGKFRWHKADWRMHQRFNFQTSDFKQELIPFGKDIMTEKIVHQSGEYGMIRRFAKVGDGWNLIYYAALNRISPKSSGIKIEGGF